MRITRNFALTKSFLLGVSGLLFLVACGGGQKTSVNCLHQHFRQQLVQLLRSQLALKL